jgi:hypothetical protein
MSAFLLHVKIPGPRCSPYGCTAARLEPDSGALATEGSSRQDALTG